MRDGKLYQLSIILGSLRDEYDKNGYISSKIRILPKGILTDWLTAMRRLQGEGILYFAITDEFDQAVYNNFADRDNELEWHYSIYNFNYSRFRAFCEKNDIPIDNPNFGNGFEAELEITAAGIPRITVDGITYILRGISVGTRVDKVIQIASSKKFFGKEISKDVLKRNGIDIGKTSLRTILQNSVFMKTLKSFAIIEPNTIQLLPYIWISDMELEKIKKQAINKH